MVFVSGIAGQLFRDQALTVTFAQLISLMVGITLVPMLTAWRARLGDREQELAADAGEPRETLVALRRYLQALGINVRMHGLVRVPTARAIRESCVALVHLRDALPRHGDRPRAAHLLRPARQTVRGRLSPFVWITQKGYNVLDRQYPALLDWALERRAAVLLTAFGLLPSRRHSAESRHRTDPATFPGRIHGEDASAGGVAARDHRLAGAGDPSRREDLPSLDSAYAVAGTGNRLDANPVDSGENTGNLDVKLRAPIDKDGEERAMQELRTQLANIPGAQYEFTRRRCSRSPRRWR
jgi:HAE1 family hydrophobic/amphiphilic exporter-1